MSEQYNAEPKLADSWLNQWKLFFHPQSIVLFALGFSSGLPFLLVSATLSAWLRDSGLEYRTIGYFAWVGLAFSLKFFWAPVVDRIQLPILGKLLGQRRSWLILAQVGIGFGLLALSWVDPMETPLLIAQIAVFVAFCAATQDVCVDAYRIQACETRLQGIVTTSYIAGYRVALLVAGAGALLLADLWNWQESYQVMALCMGLGLGVTLWIAEPKVMSSKSEDDQLKVNAHEWLARNFQGMNQSSRMAKILVWLRVNVAEPFFEMVFRFGRYFVPLLILVMVYRVSDIAMGNMANPFYLALGYTKSEIAWVTKVFGFGMTLLGAAIGGVLVARQGLYWSLMACAIAVILTNFCFALLSALGQDCLHYESLKSLAESSCQSPGILGLGLVISLDNLAAGASNVAFIAFLSAQVSLRFSATQYALLSSIMTLLGKFISGFSGLVVEGLGFSLFFVYVGCLGVPAILMLIFMLDRLPACFKSLDPSQSSSKRC